MTHSLGWSNESELISPVWGGHHCFLGCLSLSCSVSKLSPFSLSRVCGTAKIACGRFQLMLSARRANPPGGAASLCSVPLCPLSFDTNADSTRGSVSLEWLSISLSALLSPQLGTCTTILTSRGLLPAPNTPPPSVSLVVSTTAGLGRSRGLAATLCVGLVVPHSQHCSVAACRRVF